MIAPAITTATTRITNSPTRVVRLSLRRLGRSAGAGGGVGSVATGPVCSSLTARQGLPLQGLRAARGAAHGDSRALVNVLPLREGERIQSVLSTRDFAESQYLVFATKKGVVKKTEFRAPTTRRSRPTASSPSRSATTTSWSPSGARPGDEILIVSAKALAVALHRGRRARDGPRHRRVTRDERREPGQRGPDHGRRARRPGGLLVVTENGFGKRTSISEYRKTSRGARACGRSSSTEKRGAPGRGDRRARPHHELALHLPERDGPAHRRARHPPTTGRSAQGVTLMNVSDDDLCRRLRSSSSPTADAVVGGRRRDDQRAGP